MKTSLIQLSYAHSRIANDIASEINPRIKNWRSSKPTIKLKTRFLSHNCGRYSSRMPYIKWEYTPLYRSFGCICENGKKLVGMVGNERFSVSAPRGYSFSEDDLGIKIVSNSNNKDDYHFNSSEILEDKAITKIISKLRANRKTRIEKTRQEKKEKHLNSIFERDIPFIRVNIHDSR
jgi:hypothetical protein